VPLKRPVTLPQARRWPAAAKRRESFCARMGGMRELLTGERAARDPGSPINRALAAWDCDKPEGLERKHVSKGIRMKITKAKVGSEARKNPSQLGTYGPFYHDPGERLTESQIERKAESYMDRLDRMLMRGDITQLQYERESKALNKWVKEQYVNRKRNPARKPAAKNPARPKLARIMVTDDKTGEKRIETVPYDFAIKAYIGPYQHDFFVRSEGATLVVSEKSTGLRVGAVPYMKRYATMNDRDSAKAFLAETVQRVGPEKFLAAIKKAPKVI
jgi:hypothetical protein